MKRTSKEDLEALRRSGLFDEEWYLEQYPDVRMLGMEPLEHYLWVGAKLGRRPSLRLDGSALFSFDEEGNPILNHARLERRENESGEPVASTNAEPRINGSDQASRIDNNYLAMRQDVAASGFWDEQWYLSKHYLEYRSYHMARLGKEYVSPLDHYLQEGWRLGYEPSDRLPLHIDQAKVGRNKISYFLDTTRFNGYHFDKNIWTPSPSRIRKYISEQKKRTATGVVYTCVLDDYDSLMQPYHVADDWDYVCFTNSTDLIEQKTVGVWAIRPLSSEIGGPIQATRWYKMQPHVLFPDHQESLYVDGNINIISDYIFKEIERRNLDILLPQHFIRSCIYEEIEALLRSSRFSGNEKRQFQLCCDFLKREKFPGGIGLTENNVIYRRHHAETIIGLMEQWWASFNEYPPRDQMTLAYVFWKNNLPVSRHTFANCRVNYRDFWVVKHNPPTPRLSPRVAAKALRPAFARNNIAAIFSTNEQFVPYLGVAISSLIKNCNKNHNYDVIVLGNGLSDSAQRKISALATNLPNVSIRFYDTGDIFESLPRDMFHVEGYVPVETYNKCFITEILSGYDRCVYLDSDIVILEDLQKLHDTPLEGYAIAASVNVANVNAAYCKKEIKGRRFDSYLRNELGVESKERYFQAGILVLDMNALKSMNLVQKSIECLRTVRQPIFFDQCIFNRIFHGNVKFISTAWNHVWYMQDYSYLKGSVPDEVFYDYARARVDPKIIHYGSKDKPHTKSGWKLGEIFWKYAYESPFIEEILHELGEANNEVTKAMASARGSDWYKVPPRVLIHIHLYYTDQAELMLGLLKHLAACEYTLFVTIVEDDADVRKRILESCGTANVFVVPNVGYDVYPFLHVLQQVRLANFEFILKLHTKNKRSEGQDTVYGLRVPEYTWRDELINSIVGSKEIFGKNLEMLLEDKQVGCLGARRFVFSTLQNREEETYKLPEWRKKCGINTGVHYVGGSMFFSRAYPFERLKGLRMQPGDFNAPQMGTKDYKNTAHIFERLFGLVIENERFEVRGV